MTINMKENYPLIAEWIVNSQLSGDQIVKYMRDKAFATWFAKHYPHKAIQ